LPALTKICDALHRWLTTGGLRPVDIPDLRVEVVGTTQIMKQRLDKMAPTSFMKMNAK
jgi:hypothetical protein